MRIGDELLVPVYDTVKGGGSNFEYDVVGWVGFIVTGFDANGSKSTVDGYFIRVIWEGIQSTVRRQPRLRRPLDRTRRITTNKQKGKKTLMTYRVRNITIAVALALVAALLTIFYVTNYQRNVRKDETNVQVFVAKRDIPAGTSGADVAAEGMLKKSEVVRRSVVPGAISNPDQVAELVAGAADLRRRAGLDAPLRDTVAAGHPGPAHRRAARHRHSWRQEPAARRHARRPATRSTSSRRSECARARTIHVTRIVLRDIEVLRAPSAEAPETPRRSRRQDGGFAVMLKVTDTQVQKLTGCSRPHEVAPRAPPGTDAADSPENVESWYSVLREGVRQKQLNEAGVDGDPGSW